MPRPSGLATVGYGLTLVGFVQVAVTIAPHITHTLPNTDTPRRVIGVAVALAIDVVWAALMHTTITTYRNGQTRPALGFGTATGVAVAASTILLASVGHMGPWSIVPILAAVLLVADGIREHVSVSPETAAEIRRRTAEIRDARALANIEARHNAHTETINGYRESARLAARTTALADIRVTVQRAEHTAGRRIARAARRYKPGSQELSHPDPETSRPVASRDTDATPATDATGATAAPSDTDATTPIDTTSDHTPQPVAKPTTAAPVALSLVASSNDELDTRIRELVAQNAKPAKIAEELNIHRATVYRRIKAMGDTNVAS